MTNWLEPIRPAPRRKLGPRTMAIVAVIAALAALLVLSACVPVGIGLAMNAAGAKPGAPKPGDPGYMPPAYRANNPY